MQILDLNQKDYDQKRPIYEDIKIDPAFRKVSPKSIGFHIWRIQNDHLEAVPKDQYGTFYDENAYIIYSASLAGSIISDKNTINREIKSVSVTIDKFIHFWLGGNVSAEKSKTAAYKIIELDLHLDHKTTQYRETQGHEGIRFLSYFKDDGFIVQTGSDSSSTPTYPRIYQIKGKTTPECIQMNTIEWKHFTSGQIMILQLQNIIFVWIGRSTGAQERIFGLKLGNKLKETHDIPEIAVVDDGYEQSMTDKRKEIWNKYLNLSQRFVQPFVTSPSNNDIVLRLYQCDTVNGVFRVELVKTGPLEQADLYGRDNIYIVDYFTNGVWIWIGRSSPKQNRAEAMRHARGYVIKKNYPTTTPVIRVIDGLEPAEFMSIFPSWISSDMNGNSVKGALEKFDAQTLIQRPKLAAQTQLIDDGSGEMTVYQIELGDAKEISKKSSKTFFSTSCYIVHYQVISGAENNLNNTLQPQMVKHIVYLWCGSNSLPEHRKTGEVYLTEMCDHLKKNVIQIRISEGMEPAHFLQIFKGTLIIFNSPLSPEEGKKIPGSFVLKVMGNSTYTCKAIQVSSKTLYYPEDCYILKAADNEVWIWCGQYSTGDSREMAKSIASILGEYSLVMESNETDEFFNSVGEKFLQQLKKTHSTIINPTMNVSVTWDRQRVGLYLCSLNQGNIILNKIFAFEQKDLRPENIYLLDAGNIVYIWMGSYTGNDERSRCWDIARYLVQNHPVQRDSLMPMAIVKLGDEPITFTGFFDNWDHKYFENYTPFDKVRLQTESPGTPIPNPRLSLKDDQTGDDFDRYQKYPLEMLRGDPSQLPTSINPTRKEIHLTHDDFVQVFKMNYLEFEVLPKWKQVELKKQHKLF